MANTSDGGRNGKLCCASTIDSDEYGRPKMVGTINGGFYSKSETIAQHPWVVIAVDDIHESIQQITVSGGKVPSEPHEIPE